MIKFNYVICVRSLEYSYRLQYNDYYATNRKFKFLGDLKSSLI